MNPDKEDPNNHVPAVAPDDDWDGLDVKQVFDAQLPPRRSDAQKMPKADLKLSGFKSIESARHTSGGNSLHEDASLRTSVSIHVKLNPEREIAEKEEFHPTLVMEDMKLDDVQGQMIQKPVMSGRFKPGDRDDWGVVQKKDSARWMLYVASGVVFLIALTLSLSQFDWKKSDKNFKTVGGPDKATANPSKVSVADLGLLGQLANANQQAMEIYATYAQAKQVADFSDRIYLGESNSARISKAWTPIGAENGWKPADSSIWKTLKAKSIDYAELRGVSHDFSKFIAVFRYENSELKMDWKATTGYGSADFSELKTGKGDGSEIRGWIEPSNFFTEQLSEDRYRSFIVRSPGKDLSIWAYTKIGSDIDAAIMELFAISPITGEHRSEAKVILSLDKGDQGISPQQWMIKGIMADNWLDQATP